MQQEAFRADIQKKIKISNTREIWKQKLLELKSSYRLYRA